MMRFAKFILFILVCCLFSNSLRAQTVSRPEIEKRIRQFHLDEALVMANELQDRVVASYYISRVLFLKYVSSENPIFIDAFHRVVRDGLQEVEKLSDSNHEKGVVKAELHFLRGIIRMLEKKYLACSMDIKTACETIDDNQKRFPAFPEHKKLAGIFNVGLAAVPRKAQWLTNFLCFRGDMDKGIRQLKTASEESSLLPEEASVILFYIEKNLLSKPVAAHERAVKLAEKCKDCFPFQYLLASSYMELRNTEKALTILNGKGKIFQDDWSLFYSPFWTYTRAKANYFNLDLDKAVQDFTEFLDTYDGQTLTADARFRKAMALEMQGQHAKAKTEFSLLTSSSDVDEDEYAIKMAKQYLKQPPTETEITLHKARNLFDGGNYARSMTLLHPLFEKRQKLGADDLTELYYRIGRNSQELNQMEGAEEAYQNSIAQEPTMNLWMKVYSCFYLGKLYERQGKKEEAIKMYKQALTYNNYFYQSGLEQRCKAALHQLK